MRQSIWANYDARDKLSQNSWTFRVSEFWCFFYRSVVFLSTAKGSYKLFSETTLISLGLPKKTRTPRIDVEQLNRSHFGSRAILACCSRAWPRAPFSLACVGATTFPAACDGPTVTLLPPTLLAAPPPPPPYEGKTCTIRRGHFP